MLTERVGVERRISKVGLVCLDLFGLICEDLGRLIKWLALLGNLAFNSFKSDVCPYHRPRGDGMIYQRLEPGPTQSTETGD